MKRFPNSQLGQPDVGMWVDVVSASTKIYAGRFQIGVSIGIATYPDRTDTVEQLLDVADAAMYASKKNGRSTYRFGISPGRSASNVVKMTR